VMTRGKVVQMGAADALFERPQHTFVGHFIGSPGMNFLPVTAAGGQVNVAGTSLNAGRSLPEGELVLGVRPEYVRTTASGEQGALQAQVANVQDVGTSLMLTAKLAGQKVKARLAPETRIPAVGEPVWLQLMGEHTCFYKNEELVA
jgi:glycerol transport system ATP-binding protein